MAGALSADAEKLLGRLVGLGERSPSGVVNDEDLLEATGLNYDDEYWPAVQELVKGGYAENPSGSNDIPNLKATPKGIKRIQSL